jgi:DNA-binding MarR family transcriptional regulator
METDDRDQRSGSPLMPESHSDARARAHERTDGGDARTPVSDRIRARFEAAARTAAAVFAGPGWAGQQQQPGPGAECTLTDKAKDKQILPPFEDAELSDPQLLSSAAAEVYRMRRARDRVMPAGLMGEPAWDILLALYSEEPGDLTVSSLCYGSGVPATTALRWIGVLDKAGLVERSRHQRDGRIMLVSLSADGRAMIERSLKAMLRAARG